MITFDDGASPFDGRYTDDSSRTVATSKSKFDNLELTILLPCLTVELMLRRRIAFSPDKESSKMLDLFGTDDISFLLGHFKLLLSAEKGTVVLRISNDRVDLVVLSILDI